MYCGPSCFSANLKEERFFETLFTSLQSVGLSARLAGPLLPACGLVIAKKMALISVYANFGKQWKIDPFEVQFIPSYASCLLLTETQHNALVTI